MNHKIILKKGEGQSPLFRKDHVWDELFSAIWSPHPIVLAGLAWRRVDHWLALISDEWLGGAKRDISGVWPGGVTHFNFSLKRPASARPWFGPNLWCHYELINSTLTARGSCLASTNTTTSATAAAIAAAVSSPEHTHQINPEVILWYFDTANCTIILHWRSIIHIILHSLHWTPTFEPSLMMSKYLRKLTLNHLSLLTQSIQPWIILWFWYK